MDVTQLYIDNIGTLIAIATKITKNVCAAEELAHDSFIKLLECKSKIESGSAFLKTITKNAAIDYIRKSSYRTTSKDIDVYEYQAAAPTSSIYLTQAKNDRALYKAIRGLPTITGKVLLEHVLMGRRLCDIARRNGKNENTVKAQYRIGVNKLRNDSLLKLELEECV